MVLTAPSVPKATLVPLSYPPAVVAGLYSPDELRERFLFLRRDYTRIIAGTSHLPNAERFEMVRQRLADYSDAMALALGDATDDAAILVRGQRQQRGEVR